jgi:hypothetical protein
MLPGLLLFAAGLTLLYVESWLYYHLPKRYQIRGFGCLFALATFSGFVLCTLGLHRLLTSLWRLFA